MNIEEQIITTLKSEFKLRIYTESFQRIKKCVFMLQDDQIANKPNENTNSIANLILHLTGNVQQWIGHGLGDDINNRNRDLEFSSKPPFDIIKLLQNLDSTLKHAIEVVEQLPDHKWVDKKIIQGYQVSGIEILIHVIEHFSYHTGQISLQTKLMLNEDLGYYSDISL